MLIVYISNCILAIGIVIVIVIVSIYPIYQSINLYIIYKDERFRGPQGPQRLPSPLLHQEGKRPPSSYTILIILSIYLILSILSYLSINLSIYLSVGLPRVPAGDRGAAAGLGRPERVLPLRQG